jgi:hypothetical protein
MKATHSFKVFVTNRQAAACNDQEDLNMNVRLRKSLKFNMKSALPID